MQEEKSNSCIKKKKNLKKEKEKGRGSFMALG